MSSRSSRSSSTLPVPARLLLDEARMKQRGATKDRIVQLIAASDDEEWGSEGSFDSAVVTVPREHLWSHPIYPIAFSTDEITAMRNSLRTQGQRSPITVYKAHDPRTNEDATGGRYLIVDLDGELLWRAAATVRGLDVLRVRFVRYASLYLATKDTMILSATRHQTTDEEFALLFLRARRVYDIEQEQAVALPPWPKQEEWAAHLGKDQSTISRWERMARALAEPETRGALDAGLVTVTQLREVVDLPLDARQAATREVIAGNQARGKSGPLSQRETRRVVERYRPGAQWVTDVNLLSIAPPDVSKLYLPQLTELDTVQAFGVLLHDARIYLETISAAMSNPNRATKRLLDALGDPDVQRLSQEVDTPWKKKR